MSIRAIGVTAALFVAAAASHAGSGLAPAEVLVTNGPGFAPLEHAAVIAAPSAAPADTVIRIAQLPGAPDAESGYPVVGGMLLVDAFVPVARDETATALEPGDLALRLYQPFDAATLAGADPKTVIPVVLDEDGGAWRLATALNEQDSPGRDRPVGAHVIVTGGGDDWGQTGVLGDSGVYWDPSQQRGFVWANVDRTGEFGLGLRSACAGDCATPFDGRADIDDLLAVLDRWPDGGSGPCDLDLDGDVTILDLAAVLETWGTCAD